MSNEESSPHTQPEIGQALERARVERGLSFWQVEEATKIRARYLYDLERENFDVLPAVYVLGSLKTYADYLGLDGEAMVLRLKNRQAPPQEELHPTNEGPAKGERGGFLASLGALLGFGDRDAAEDDEDEGVPQATAPGHGPRLYWGFGAVLILVLMVALASTLGGGGQPTVSHVRAPETSEPPSRIAFSGNVRDEGDTDRNRETPSDQPENETTPPDEGDEKDEKEEKDQEKSGREDQDDTRSEEDAAGDVALALPAPITASASSTASASASAGALASAPASAAPEATAPASASASVTSTATASATSAPVTNAPASVSSATTAPATTDRTTATPAAPDPVAAAPAGAPAAAAEPVAPGSAPRPTRAEPAPAAIRTAPAASRAPGGSGFRQAEGGGGGLDASRLSDAIFSEVRKATRFAR